MSASSDGSLSAAQEQAVALVVLAMDRHPDAVQQAGCRDHDLGVALAHRVVGDDARDDAAAEQQSREAQGDVDDDLDVDPAVIRHAEPPGRVDRRHVPPRLELLVGVRRPRAAARDAGCRASGPARGPRRAPPAVGSEVRRSLRRRTRFSAARPRECHPGRRRAGLRTPSRPVRGPAGPPGSSRARSGSIP